MTPLPCIYRGPELRREQCPTCKPGVGIKVFACTLFEVCEIENYLEGVHSCKFCEDRRPPPQE